MTAAGPNEFTLTSARTDLRITLLDQYGQPLTGACFRVASGSYARTLCDSAAASGGANGVTLIDYAPAGQRHPDPDDDPGQFPDGGAADADHDRRRGQRAHPDHHRSGPAPTPTATPTATATATADGDDAGADRHADPEPTDRRRRSRRRERRRRSRRATAADRRRALPFADGFESGTLAAWTDSENFGIAPANDPLGGAFQGAAVSSGQPSYVRAELAAPTADIHVRTRFFLAARGEGTAVDLVRIRDAENRVRLTVAVGGNGRLALNAHDGGGSRVGPDGGAGRVARAAGALRPGGPAVTVWYDGLAVDEMSGSGSAPPRPARCSSATTARAWSTTCASTTSGSTARRCRCWGSTPRRRRRRRRRRNRRARRCRNRPTRSRHRTDRDRGAGRPGRRRRRRRRRPRSRSRPRSDAGADADRGEAAGGLIGRKGGRDPPLVPGGHIHVRRDFARRQAGIESRR